MRTKLLLVVLALALVAGGFLGWSRVQVPSLCGGNLPVRGSRCCAEGQTLSEDGRCTGRPRRCPPGLQLSHRGCVAVSRRVEVPAGRLRATAASDWEPQAVRGGSNELVSRFWIDSHEVTEVQYLQCVEAKGCPKLPRRGEDSLPQTHVSLVDAKRYCRFAGGRLPRLVELQWAASQGGGRYPWGNTGLVCRRLAFGLAQGPCRHGGGPQWVGVHPDGATASGLHDLAGNVAEWTREGLAFGGSWRSQQASDLRVWSFRRPPPLASPDDIGLRCVYDKIRR